MKDFRAIQESFRHLSEIEDKIGELQENYISICCSLTDGHESQTVEWYQSVDFEDSLKIEEYHNRIKDVLQVIEEARTVLLTSRIGQSVLVDKEIEILEDPNVLTYKTEAQRARKKQSRIFVFEYDNWNDEESEREIVVDDLHQDVLRSWTSQKIYDYVRENCVGKCNTMSGTEEYYLPCIKIGKLMLSVQVNYRIWSDRTDRHFGVKEHAMMITGVEFDNCINTETQIDLAISYNERRLMCGQASMEQISRFLSNLADGDVYINESYL